MVENSIKYKKNKIKCYIREDWRETEFKEILCSEANCSEYEGNQ